MAKSKSYEERSFAALDDLITAYADYRSAIKADRKHDKEVGDGWDSMYEDPVTPAREKLQVAYQAAMKVEIKNYVQARGLDYQPE